MITRDITNKTGESIVIEPNQTLRVVVEVDKRRVQVGKRTVLDITEVK